jgi:phosphoglycerol transferase MdoB-like AlkP superfamily enzyme
LGSLYPWLSHNSITKEHPALPIKTISSELKARGYRTSFFNSGDGRFQKANKFLSHRSFDLTRDCKDLSCSTQFSEEKEGWEDLDGTDDACTGEAMLNWIDADHTKPFFTLLWTYQTHYPYYCCGPEKKFGTGDTVLNRYLNAVNHSDMVLGNILEELKQKGLDRSTLVVVIGDHGEAFGRHNQTTHASRLYEENVHIPCVFINPELKAETVDAIGGMADVAPTIMSMLGYSTPKEWQGEDLLANRTKDRTYFFCPWSDYLFGYRKGNMKYIYNATKNLTEVYDLSKDPHETNNLSENVEVNLNHLELAAWVQYQDKFMKDLIARSGK